jgi:hypothetical protein
MKYLARECNYCGQIVKIQMEGSKIIHIEGARPLKIWPYDRITIYRAPAQSTKTVVCLGKREQTGQFDQRRICHRQMYISTFKEIKG